ncbi:MAG: hypothetical protein ACUVTL_08520 [Thermoproteota archaeon]
MNRPLGVTILAIIEIIFGITMVLGAAALMTLVEIIGRYASEFAEIPNFNSIFDAIGTQDGLVMDGFTVQSKIYGGATDTLVWGRRIGNLIEVGFGRRS